jgi:hypothetical protein
LRILVSSESVEVFDFVEVAVELGVPVFDPFRTVILSGVLMTPDGNALNISGFCDSRDGSVHRIRFMPMVEGEYSYRISLASGEINGDYEGRFNAIDGERKGILQTDGWFFRWSGTGEPFFWNATTGYLMAGLRDDVMFEALERLSNLGVNRIRVALCPSRQKDGGRWHEPQVKNREDFTFFYSPWPEHQPDSLTEPQRDLTRFEIAYWQKFETLLIEARERNIIIQVIFFVDAQEDQNYPFPRTEIGTNSDEQRYYAYAAARLAAFSNVEWCLTNEWKLFRPDAWADIVGEFLSSQDPYHHISSVHGHGVFPFRESSWVTHALFQVWDEHGGYDWALQQRAEQAATGRIIPQVNEEYGYEDHYPGPWGEGRVAPARSADNRRRLAWEMTMAGIWQTTGESAASGSGGWINALGDNDELLRRHSHLKNFFDAFDWTKLTPEGSRDNMTLSEPGVRYIRYLPDGGSVDMDTDGAPYRARWYDPRTGKYISANRTPAFQSPTIGEDWVLLLERVPD